MKKKIIQIMRNGEWNIHFVFVFVYFFIFWVKKNDFHDSRSKNCMTAETFGANTINRNGREKKRAKLAHSMIHMMRDAARCDNTGTGNGVGVVIYFSFFFFFGFF